MKDSRTNMKGGITASAFRCGSSSSARRAASEHKIKWIELNVQPDHVQGTATIPMTMAPTTALQLLKGRSSYLFFRNHEKIRFRYPKGHLWARGKFGAT